MSHISDAIIANALGDEAGVRLAMARESVRVAVMTTCTCACGQILDQQTAVLYEVGRTEADLHAVGVWCPECAPEITRKAQAVCERLGGIVKVTDGRELYPKRAPRLRSGTKRRKEG